jgi:hypothetical protein
MTQAKTKNLHHRLPTQGASPSDDLSKIIVGDLQKHGSLLVKELNEICRNDKPSRAHLILGPNGNGKTLLNFILQNAASELNTKKNIRDLDVTSEFNVLFSRISINKEKPLSFALELSKNLKRSIYEDAELTYSIIAHRIVNDFINQQNLGLRSIPMIPVKWSLKKIVKNYEETLEGLFTTDEIDPVLATLDTLFEKLQRKMNKEWIGERFQEFASRKKLSSFLIRYLTAGSSPVSSHQLNEDLTKDIGQYQRSGSPLDAVKALKQITSDVGCKVLLLMIDDCNLKYPPEILLPLLDSLHEFNNPKLYLVVSGVMEVWDNYELKELADKSLYEKLYIFGDPIFVKSPTKDTLKFLFDRLFTIVNDELSSDGAYINVEDKAKTDILANCPLNSYRSATHHILKKLSEIKKT